MESARRWLRAAAAAMAAVEVAGALSLAALWAAGESGPLFAHGVLGGGVEVAQLAQALAALVGAALAAWACVGSGCGDARPNALLVRSFLALSAALVLAYTAFTVYVVFLFGTHVYDASDVDDISLWVTVYVVVQVLLPLLLILLWIAAFITHFRVVGDGDGDGDDDDLSWTIDAGGSMGQPADWQPKKQKKSRMMRYDHFPPVAYSDDLDPRQHKPLFNT